ncbi:hypothetical protein SMY46_002084 [Cronobacter turicensis]|nr:hypothetical protein [Cronobacter turicensis]ELU8455701.1 hypothetical protein [Cronobacter turicensis]ELY4110407.1 hypothetical protein [Cronobacter turicensis]ELY4214592.1 hypothetical protein [Cronobacter turicensis]EMA1792431.1 hypothetical protein [Cronobacter turicensis]
MNVTGGHRATLLVWLLRILVRNNLRNADYLPIETMRVVVAINVRMFQKKHQKSTGSDGNKPDLPSQMVNNDGLAVVKCFYLSINIKQYNIGGMNYLYWLFYG